MVMVDLGKEPLVDELAREMNKCVLMFMGDTNTIFHPKDLNELSESVTALSQSVKGMGEAFGARLKAHAEKAAAAAAAATGGSVPTSSSSGGETPGGGGGGGGAGAKGVSADSERHKYAGRRIAALRELLTLQVRGEGGVSSLRSLAHLPPPPPPPPPPPGPDAQVT